MVQRTAVGFLFRVLSLGAFLVLAGGCGDASPPFIGISMGQDAVGGARMAMEELGEGLEVEFSLRQEGSNRADLAIGSADTLVALPGLVAVVGHSNSAASLAASQIYNPARVVQVAPHSSAPVYSEAGPFSFRMVPPDDRQGAFLARKLAETFDEVPVAVLYVNDDYGRGLRSAFLAALDRERFPPVLQLPHTEEIQDPELVSRTVRALERAGPGVVVWLGRGSRLAPYLDSLRAALGPVPVWGSDAVQLLDPGASRGPAWRGVWYVDFDYPEDDPRVRSFLERYRQRFEREPRTVEILTYDAVGVLLEGIRSGVRTGPRLREFLVSLGRDRPPYPGLSGPVAFEDDGDLDRTYVLRQVPASPETPSR